MSRLCFVVLIGLLACGCAAASKKPPTPAARIDERELARVPPPPGERYYLMVFASQRVPKVPRYTHSWATVVRTVGGPGAEQVAEVLTISWMPVGQDLRPWYFKLRPGVNLDLSQSIDDALGKGERVSMWGPYEVWHGFYTRFRVQKEFLESGQVGEQVIDTVGEAGRTGLGTDCIHAISDMDPAYNRSRYPLLYFGDAASWHIVRRIMQSPVVIDPPTTHDWLIPAVGLDRYPIVRRAFHGRTVPYRPGSAGLQETPVVPVLPAVPVPKK